VATHEKVGRGITKDKGSSPVKSESFGKKETKFPKLGQVEKR